MLVLIKCLPQIEHGFLLTIIKTNKSQYHTDSPALFDRWVSLENTPPRRCPL